MLLLEMLTCMSVGTSQCYHGANFNGVRDDGKQRTKKSEKTRAHAEEDKEEKNEKRYYLTGSVTRRRRKAGDFKDRYVIPGVVGHLLGEKESCLFGVFPCRRLQ